MNAQPFGGHLKIASMGALNDYDDTIDTSLGLAETTSEAFGVTVVRTYPVGLASTTDTAFGLTHSRTAGIGLASETDTAFSANADKPIPAVLGLASETDTAFSVNVRETAGIGLASETDTAFATTFTKSVSIGLASETGTAFPVTFELLLFEDTFTETTNTALGSHTPDYDTSGAGWNVWDGSLTVDATDDDVGPTGADGQYTANTGDLGATEYTIEAQFAGSTSSGGDAFGWGLCGRNSANNVMDGWYCEFAGHVPYYGLYEGGEGGPGGYSVGSWPGTDAWIKAEITTSGCSFYSSADGSSWTLRRSATGTVNSSTGRYVSLFFYDFGSNLPLPCTYIKIYAS